MTRLSEAVDLICRELPGAQRGSVQRRAVERGLQAAIAAGLIMEARCCQVRDPQCPTHGNPRASAHDHGGAQRVRRLRAGRSKQSMLVLAGRDVHVFVWAPPLGADSFGVTLRRRRGDDWTHWRVVVWQRGGERQTRGSSKRGGQRFCARPTLTVFEASRWRTVGGTQTREGIKAYVRVKVGPGGRQLANDRLGV